MKEFYDALRATAAQWRARHEEGKGGIVMIWEGEAYAWKNEVRDPQCERPGVYAVDEAGKIFIAVGGDDYNGAERWVVKQPAVDDCPGSS
ncbi:hypothetical protein D3C81_213020 [compost metagenome]